MWQLLNCETQQAYLSHSQNQESPDLTPPDTILVTRFPTNPFQSLSSHYTELAEKIVN